MAIKLAVILALIGGNIHAYVKRGFRAQLLAAAYRHHNPYAGSGDSMLLKDCRIDDNVTPEDLESLHRWGRDVSGIGGQLSDTLGRCRLDFTFHDYPAPNQSGVVRVESRFVWAGRAHGWVPWRSRALD